MQGVRGIHKFNGGHIGVSNINNTFGGMWSIGETANPFTAIFPTFGATYKDIVKTDLPIAYWRLDEASGATTAVDEMGNHNGTYNGSPTLGAAKLIQKGTAVDFDGTDDYVEAADHADFDFAGSFTLEAWVQPDDVSSNRRILNKSEGSTGGRSWIHRINSDGTFRFYIWDGATFIDVASATVLSVGVTYHLVGVLDATAGEMRVYVDGVLDGVLSTTATAATSTVPVFVGTGKDANGALIELFDGRIDEPAAYDHALTATEIRRHYYRGLGYTEYALETLTHGPVAYWKLDEETGTTATDETGNNDGTYNGSPTLQQNSLIQSGNSVQFDGTDDYIAVSDSPFDFGTTDFSIVAWINLDSIGPFHTIAHHRDVGGTDNGYIFGIRDTGALAAYTQGSGGSGEVISSTTLVSGRTYFVVATWDRDSNVTLYINGNQDSTLDISTFGDISTTDNLRIGWSTPATTAWDYFGGLLDEPAIFDSVLTHNQIMDMYIAGKQYTGYAKEVLETLPVAYWKLDEESGTTAVAEVGSDGTYNGNPTLDQDPLIQNGRSVQFDGIDDYVSQSHIPNSTGTATFWLSPVNGAGTTNENFFSAADSGGNARFTMQNFNDGQTYWGWIDSSGIDHRIILADAFPASPFFVALTWDGGAGTSQLYWNETLKGEVSGITIPSIDTSPFIGATNDGSANDVFDFSAGLIDEVSLYDSVLTATEIRRHYYAGLGYSGYPLSVLSGGPVAYWRLDEESGIAAADETGNHDGTYNGSPTLTAAKLINSGTAVDFDGVDDYVDASSLGVMSFPITLEFWVSLDALNCTVVTTHWVSNVYYGVAVQFLSGGELHVRLGDGFGDGEPNRKSFVTDTTFSTGVVYHVVAVVKSMSDADIYVNSASQTWTLSGSASTMDTSSGLPNIGRSVNGSFLQGRVDEPTVYNRALAVNEIEEHYGLGRFGV